MARSRSRGKKATGGRQARATSRRKAAPTAASAEAEVVEEGENIGTEGAIAIITTVVLVLGLIFLDMELGRHYGAGLFF
jgi:hypothetical protein